MKLTAPKLKIRIAESFKLTELSLENLNSEGLPEDIITKLKTIKNQQFTDRLAFLDKVKSIIGDEQTFSYDPLILKHARMDIQSTGDIIDYVMQTLGNDFHWQGKGGEAGWALVNLFGRLIELVLNRLNQVPDKHFLAFLNQAGVDRLPPRAASTEVTFTLAKDAPAAIRVPAGTQVATLQTATSQEVIFETLRDVIIAPNALVKCIAFDPLNYSDCTKQATGQVPGSFPPFQGDHERERILYLGDDELFTFPDVVSRDAATVIFSFELDSEASGKPVDDGGKIEWLYWDGTVLTNLVQAGSKVEGDAKNFSQDGEVKLTNLPLLDKAEVNGQIGRWIACKLTGGINRHYLPLIKKIEVSRKVEIKEATARIDNILSAIQSGTAFVTVELESDAEFFPLGQNPGRLDTFYLRSDEAFTKQGATIEIIIDLVGIPNNVNDITQLDNLRVGWEYFSTEGWKRLGVSGWKPDEKQKNILNFEDKTYAFTGGYKNNKNGKSEARYVVKFNIPEDSEQPLFAQTTINGQKGFWIRARIIEGGYTEKGYFLKESDKKTNNIVKQNWIEPRSHAPLIKNLRINISNYEEKTTGSRLISFCKSHVDGIWRDHKSPEGDFTSEGFAPFSAPYEGPALYLGFRTSFPSGKWNHILLDVAEEKVAAEKQTMIFWEYWSGKEWHELQNSDGSKGLSVRGYLGFFGPDDHEASAEFGQKAYWYRTHPPILPIAEAGQDLQVAADKAKVATVTLDASASRTTDEQKKIIRYLWRIVEPEKRAVIINPDLKAVYINTVPVLNALTSRDEVLGSSDGKPDQCFTLTRSPVLPGVQIFVREPDHPSSDELQQLHKELQQVEKKAPVMLPMENSTPGQGVWVRWHQVTDFYDSDSSSRHFTLDPINGRVSFGNGNWGKIPPVGRDNIKAMLYRTHDGARGNVETGAISVLRNPTGELANIKNVANIEAAGGGSDAETVDEVKQRGPQSLKHRQRAVTAEDFIWMAREATGEVAHATCLPTCNHLGLTEAGWVTVIITPNNMDRKPLPGMSLVRQVQDYLETHALMNFKESQTIHVKGPDYIEASVFAKIAPTDPEKADETELAVLDRLESFLHPSRGGSKRKGWELGRSVYLSEVYAEIEAVVGVDHVTEVKLSSSLAQYRLDLKKEYWQTPLSLSVGCQVSTFDEHIKLRLAEPIFENKELKNLAVYGFREGDHVAIVAENNEILRDHLTIESLEPKSQLCDTIRFMESFFLPDGADALMSPDKRIRIPLRDDINRDSEGNVVQVKVKGFEAGDLISLIVIGPRRSVKDFLPIERVEPCQDRIFVPEGCLICSGSHIVEMTLE